MWVFYWFLATLAWFGWLYPFFFRAPRKQDRSSITVAGPTRVGLLLEGVAIALAFLFHMPFETSPELPRVAAALALAAGCSWMMWQAILHLGRQFRVHAGLYEDHELVRTGPYAFVRHPIYTSMLGMLLCTILLVSDLRWAPLPLAMFIVGTEIRVRCEDALLASRFGDGFSAYRRAVRAYIPFVR